MSSCEFFRALTNTTSLGGKVVIVKLIKGNDSASDIVINGKAMLGIANDAIIEVANKALAENRIGEAMIGDTRVIAEPIEVRPTIIVVGSGLIAKALVDVGSAVGYYVAVVGNNDVNKDTFSNAYFVTNDLGDLEKLVVNGSSIVIIANEGGKPYDADALYMALKGGARFVGLLASQRRAAVMIADMVRRGLELDYVLSRLHSPVGLDIGAKTPGEIALSILAEVTMFIRNASGKPMMEVRDPRKLLKDALEGRIQETTCGWRPSQFGL